jgi:transposase
MSTQTAPATKSEAIQKTLLKLLEKMEKPLDVGRGAEKYFRVSLSTLNRALAQLTSGGGAKIFYVPKKNRVDGRKTLVKVLAPGDWSFSRAAAYAQEIVSIAHLNDEGSKLNRDVLDPNTVVSKRTAAIVKKVVDRNTKIEKVKALHNDAYSIKEIADTMGIAESTVRVMLSSGDEMITLHSLSTLTLRIREYKRDSMSNVAIANRLGISESTVRRRLKTPLTEEETLLEAMYDALSHARESILEEVSNNPMFDRVFGDGDGWVLRINTTKRRAGFTRRDGAGQRMTFSLEFAAYRQPVPKESTDG